MSIRKSYDLLKWAIPTLTKFPRDQRFLLGDRIENHTPDILEPLICAYYSRNKLGYLRDASLKPLRGFDNLWRAARQANS